MDDSWPPPSEKSLSDRGDLTSPLRKALYLLGEVHFVKTTEKPYLMASSFALLLPASHLPT